MKLFARITAFLLVLILILSSCQAEETEIVPDYDENSLSSVNLNGTVVNWGWSGSADSTFGFMNGTSLADIAAKRQKDVENEFNCKLNIIYSDGGNENTFRENQFTILPQAAPTAIANASEQAISSVFPH